jgi:hypothetical protein
VLRDSKRKEQVGSAATLFERNTNVCASNTLYRECTMPMDYEEYRGGDSVVGSPSSRTLWRAWEAFYGHRGPAPTVCAGHGRRSCTQGVALLLGGTLLGKKLRRRYDICSCSEFSLSGWPLVYWGRELCTGTGN